MKIINEIPYSTTSLNLKSYDPKTCFKNMLDMGYDEDYAKNFINKQVRELKAQANNIVLREMALMSGYDPEVWATLEEIA